MAEKSIPKYSKQVLEETPPKATKFLGAIGAEPVIRTLMEQGKMTDEHLNEGVQLLVTCLGQLPSPLAQKDTPEARQQRAATAELDQWDEPNFARLGATLRRHFPSAEAYLFFNLAASTGALAVLGVATLLTRIDALENGSDPARADSKKDDKKAVELLAERGLDKQERLRLSALVDLALRPTTTIELVNDTQLARDTQREAALTALKDWYEEWSTTARVVVKKRAYLIRMGLASRKSAKGEGSGAPPK